MIEKVFINSICGRCIHVDVCSSIKDNRQKCGSYLEQRPHGDWIEKCTSFGGKCWAKCSVCNEFADGFGRDNGFGHDYFYPNFCPNCGADMREGEAE